MQRVLERPHAQLLHDPAGCDVLWLVDAHYLVQTEAFEPILERRSTSFGREPSSPPGWIQPPADLDRGHDLG